MGTFRTSITLSTYVCSIDPLEKLYPKRRFVFNSKDPKICYFLRWPKSNIKMIFAYCSTEKKHVSTKGFSGMPDLKMAASCARSNNNLVSCCDGIEADS